MRRAVAHSHACQDCGADTPCVGTLVANVDGFPDVICQDFHQRDGTTHPDFICEGCQWKREDARKVS